MLVKFTAVRYYKGCKYNVDDIIDMPYLDFKIYLDFKAVKKCTSRVKIILDDLNYAELRKLAKKHNIPAVGKKTDLIEALRKKGY